ncbi:hypothetical protein PENTCL1PPCAC_13708, partial [Pristionchus entomophagus]
FNASGRLLRMKWFVKSLETPKTTPPPSASDKTRQGDVTVKTDGTGTDRKTPSLVSAQSSPFDDANANRVRFTLENVLDRYGGLHNMRRQLLAYSFILFATQLFINFWKTRMEIVKYDNVSLSEHRGSPLCCCTPSERLKSLSAGLREMYLDTSAMDMWHSIAFLVSAICCPLLERIGRRRMVLISLPFSAVSLLILALIRHEKLISAMIFVQSISYAATYLTTTCNVLEMLPRSTRMVGIAFVQMARTHPTVFNAFYTLFPSNSLTATGILIAFINIVAFAVALKFGCDSLCHIVVNDRIVEADARVMKEEMALLKQNNPSIDLDNLADVDSHYVKKVVQMITDDLAFAEDDSYTVRQFMKRMVRNKPFYRLLYDFFAIILSGAVDGLCQVYLHEMDVGGSTIISLKVMAKVGSVAGMFFIRNWSRLRAAKTMMFLMIVNLAARGAIVHYNPNYCTSIVLWPDIQLGSGVLTTMLYLLNEVNIYCIMLNATEQAPTVLRIPICAFYVLLMEVVKGATKSSFGKIRDVYRVSFISTSFCILLGFGLFFRKVLDGDSFSVFLNDLVKDRTTGKSPDVSPQSDETLREKTPQPKTPTVK